MVRVIGFDHIVLRVKNPEASLRFYGDLLGMERLRVDQWRAGQVGFPSLRASEHTIIDLVKPPEGTTVSQEHSNMDHFCMVIESGDFEGVKGELEAAGALAEGQPQKRWGSKGIGTSIYINDPDGNHIEIKHYP